MYVDRSFSTITFVQKRTAARWIREGKWGEHRGGESLRCVSKPRSVYVGASSSREKKRPERDGKGGRKREREKLREVRSGCRLGGGRQWEKERERERDADGTREESRGEEVAPAWKCSVRARLRGLVRAEHRRQSGGNVHCRVGMQISKTDSRPLIYVCSRFFYAIFSYCIDPVCADR